MNGNGSHLEEVGIIKEINSSSVKNLSVGQTIIRVSKKYFRPSEVDFLHGNAEKAKNKLDGNQNIILMI